MNIILDGIVKRACNEGIAEIELINLQSIFLKLLAHLKNLEDIFSLVGLFNLSCGFTSLVNNESLFTIYWFQVLWFCSLEPLYIFSLSRHD